METMTTARALAALFAAAWLIGCLEALEPGQTSPAPLLALPGLAVFVAAAARNQETTP